ncbi:MAG: response regulator [Verrucomicrobiae bacterium]|nr:response regulator [Verrucomicrobiae bacterium]MCP5540791.1 response regulator [Akkermansiaceae bacterium]MCP5551305.1 response regulator [Akkermansiaceae bacterium]
MNRILIATGDMITAEGIQGALSSSGFQTAAVTDVHQLVDFCSKHTPDLTVIDLALPGGSVWAAVQAVRRSPATTSMPFLGIGAHVSQTEMQHAFSLGFTTILPQPVNARDLVTAVRHGLAGAESAPSSPPASNITDIHAGAEVTPASDPIARLQQLITEILAIVTRLRPSVSEFGPEGPELFGYIDGSGAEIREKLDSILAEGREKAAIALQDKDLRHDFRNMIGSVTGFAELILMEPSVPAEARPQLTRIRECSRVFVDLLDQQKAAAAA